MREYKITDTRLYNYTKNLQLWNLYKVLDVQYFIHRCHLVVIIRIKLGNISVISSHISKGCTYDCHLGIHNVVNWVLMDIINSAVSSCALPF